jgi:PKD repeat protein
MLFIWDFGDGNTSVGMKTSHVYARVGTYNVTLSVTDGEATTNAAIGDVLIEAHKGPPPPPPDGDGDDDDRSSSSSEGVTGCIVLVLLAAVLVALLALTFRRRRKDA